MSQFCFSQALLCGFRKPCELLTAPHTILYKCSLQLIIKKNYIEFCHGNYEDGAVTCCHTGRRGKVDLKVIVTEAERANQWTCREWSLPFVDSHTVKLAISKSSASFAFALGLSVCYLMIYVWWCWHWWIFNVSTVSSLCFCVVLCCVQTRQTWFSCLLTLLSVLC